MLLRPIILPSFVKEAQHDPIWFLQNIENIRSGIERLQSDDPEVTIIIPAYNEEASILRTLYSLSKSKTSQRLEILVVDNNSTDTTAELVKNSGARYLLEKKQGVKHARTAGLMAARGKFILNADADSIYSPEWIDLMTLPLRDQNVACTYGHFAFFPENNTSRLFYFFYESFADVYKRVIQELKDESMYVYGCSSGYRRAQGIAVNGYEHPEGSNEDGYMGLKLRARFGRLKRISSNKALVWTSDRRLNEEGGLYTAFTNRVKKIFFVNPSPSV